MAPLKYDSDGRIVIDAVADIASWANGLPFTADGALAVSGDLPAGVQNGVPFVDGKVSVDG